MKKFFRGLFFSLFIVSLLILASCNKENKNNNIVEKNYSINYLGIDDAINPNTVFEFNKDSDSIKLVPAIKDGYDFLGWNDGTEIITEIKKGTEKNVNLTATWKEHEYKIYYENLRDAENPNEINTYKISDEKIDLLYPYKEGYNFEGWTYNGEGITSLDCNLKKDITLVANWSDHYCHIELEWDLAEENRFYFLNEPYLTSFYLFGKKIQVAPKVVLVYGEKNERLEIPYYSGNYLNVTGFDSKTVGTKHVSIEVRGIRNYDTNEVYNAATSFDIDVKDYDHDYYGYEEKPESMELTCPSGYTLNAKVKHEELVFAYNWMSSNEAEEHADSCSEQSYNPYECFKGKSALTNTLIAPSTYYDYPYECLKLLTIYEDLTRIYTDEILIIINDSEKPVDETIKIGEYVVPMGEVFDLKEHNIGSGNISFNRLADVDPNDGLPIIEFVFDNVNYSDYFLIDGLRASPGLEYFYSTEEEIHYVIKLIGSNYILNTYNYQGAPGIGFNFQHTGQGENNAYDLTITGSGSLHMTGGTPALYVTCPLIIDAEIETLSYLGRMCNGINANAIKLTENAYVHGTNSGTGMLAMRGNILIDDDARVDYRLSMPRINGTFSNLNAINAAQDIYISKADIYVEAIANADIFNELEGVDSCVLINAGNMITLNEANVDLRIKATNSINIYPVFDTAVGMNAGAIFIENNSTINLDTECDLFNSAYGIFSPGGIGIENSIVNINSRCIVGLNGIYSNGNVTIVNSSVTIYGRATSVSEGFIFGVFANRNFELTNSYLKIDFNKGIAIASYIGRKERPSFYEEGYNVIRLTDIVLKDNEDFGQCCIMADDEDGGFDTFETIYNVDNNIWVNYIEVDNRL